MPADAIKEAAEANGIKERTLRRAMKELGIRPQKDDKHWVWELPPNASRKPNAPRKDLD